MILKHFSKPLTTNGSPASGSRQRRTFGFWVRNPNREEARQTAVERSGTAKPSMTKIAQKANRLPRRRLDDNLNTLDLLTKGGKKALKRREKWRTPRTSWPSRSGGWSWTNRESGRRSVASLCRAQFLTAVWISPQNTGSHGNLSLIHKSPAPIQSNLIPSLGRASPGPPTPLHPYRRTTQHRLSVNLVRIILATRCPCARWRISPCISQGARPFGGTVHSTIKIPVESE